MESGAGADSRRMESAGPAGDHVPHRVADPEDPPREMSGLAWGAIVSLGLVAILGLVRIAAALDLRSKVGDQWDNSGPFGTYAAASVFHELVFLVAAGAFIAWFFRAYANLRRLGVANLRYRTGWAIGAWFIPIFNWVRPKQIADDVWRGSKRGVGVLAQWRQVKVPGLLHWWWGLFVIQGILLQVGQRMAVEGYNKQLRFGTFDSGVAQIERAALVNVVGGICSFAAAVLAIMVVRRVSRRLDRIREDVLAGTPR